MQTFLPYRSFEASAKVLDRARLGKQRVETLQLMTALTLNIGRWGRHPAALMWKGHEFYLLRYQEAVCNEWTSRGYRDTCLVKTRNLWFSSVLSRQEQAEPFWLGKKQFHSAHRANLLRKDPEHYGQFGWKEEPAEGYFWPVRFKD